MTRPSEACSTVGGRALRRRAEHGWQGEAPRRQVRRDDDAFSLRFGRRQPAHLDRGLGHRHLLERVRRQHADAWQGHVLRLTPGECRAIPGRGEGRLGTQARPGGPDHRQAAGPALLSTRDAGAQGARRAAYDAAAAQRGETLFNGNAKCSTCHVPPIFTEPGNNLHTADEIGIDSFQADRGPERSYVTTPLRALFDTQKIHKGGFYHDGRFADSGRRRRALRPLPQAASVRQAEDRPDRVLEVDLDCGRLLQSLRASGRYAATTPS